MAVLAVLQTMPVVVAAVHPLLVQTELLLAAMVETAQLRQLVQFPLFTQAVEAAVVYLWRLEEGALEAAAMAVETQAVGNHQPLVAQTQAVEVVGAAQTLTPTLFQEPAALVLSFFAIRFQPYRL